MIEILIETCKILGLVALIMFSLVVIYAVVQTIIDSVVKNRMRRKFLEESFSV